MAEGRGAALGETPYQQAQAGLNASTLLPQLVVVDADDVLWPGTAQRFTEDVLPFPEASEVLSAVHAKGIRIAVVASPSEAPTDTSEQGDRQSDTAGSRPGPSLLTRVQTGLKRSGLSGLVSVLSVCEAHWKGLRSATGVPGASCLAFVGSAGRVRAANRIGAATVLCRKGLTAESLLTGLQVYAAKAEDDRGF